ncbi:hypothetical protein [Fodinibius salinus]|nr:hypothetical protein [Fodinibius salinus]
MQIQGPEGPLQVIDSYTQVSSSKITVIIIVAFAIVADGLPEEPGWRGYDYLKSKNPILHLPRVIIALYAAL